MPIPIVNYTVVGSSVGSHREYSTFSKKTTRFIAGGFFVAFCFCPPAVPAQSVSNAFWQAQSIYQIVTDRFFDGDPPTTTPTEITPPPV